MELDLRLALMSGIDIPIPECQLVLHQPTIKEIAYIGEKNFFIGVQCLNIRKSMISQGESLLADTNNFQIFMTVMAEPSEVEKKEAVKQVLQLLFPSYKVSFTPRSLLFVGTELTATVDEMNFEALQQVVRQALCVNSGPMDQQTFNPANEKAREIAEKLMRGRQRVAAQKGSSNSKKTKVATISRAKLLEIAQTKLPDLNAYDVEHAMKIVEGTARNMGIKIEESKPKISAWISKKLT